MTGTAAKMQRERTTAADDEQLIKQCLKGNQAAWSTLIDKYKNLIYSIPIKMGMYQDAGDIFQAVCVDLLNELPKLREHKALPKWLMQTCYHKCLHYQKNASRQIALDPVEAENQESTEILPEHMLLELEKEQSVRNAIAEISARCQQLIQMLFFELPPR